MKIGIVGYGFVGKAVKYGFENNHAIFIYDRYMSQTLSLKEVCERSEIIFVCLPTPFDNDTLHIDLSIMDEVIEEICSLVNDKLIVIKSTVVPGTTQSYSQKYTNNSFAFNPEFLTEKNHLHDFMHPDRIILGGDDEAITKLKALYRSMQSFRHTNILMMSVTAAEIVKYQANILLATKVAICNIFYDLCETLNEDYEMVRAGTVTDKRIGLSHTSVTKERGFGGKCFTKDLAAIIGRCKELKVDCKLLEEIFDYNLRIRKEKDWEKIPGAIRNGAKYLNDEQ